MSRPIVGYQVGPAICAALGLEGAKVRRLTLDIAPDAPVSVTIERFVDREEFGRLVLVVERFNLVEPERDARTLPTVPAFMLYRPEPPLTSAHPGGAYRWNPFRGVWSTADGDAP